MADKKQQNSLDPVLDASIFSLIRQGKHDDAWKRTLDLNEIFRLYYQIQIKLDQAQYIESQKILEEALNLTYNHPDPKIKNIWYKLKLYKIVVLLIIDAKKGIDANNDFHSIPQPENEFTLGMNNLISGLIHNDPSYFKASIDHLKASEELIMLGLSYIFLCHYYGGEKAIKLADEAIGIFQQFGHKNYVSISMCLKGYFYQSLGDYKTARVLNTKAFEECSKTNWIHGVANANICLGSIAIEEGNISEAIRRLEFSSKKFFQDQGTFPGLAILIEAYRFAGMYNQGLEVSLDMLDRTTVTDPIIYEYFFVQITLLALNLNQLDRAKELYEHFKVLVGTTPNSRIENSLKLCEALILKQSKSLRTSYKAQDMMRELLQSDAVSYTNRIVILKHLSELLLLEYELYEQEEILDEVQQYVNNLFEISKTQNLLRLTFEAQIISSKLELLKNDFGKARKILVDLLDYAGANNLSVYERVVSKEIAVLDENYNKWLDLVEGNSSMRELMEKTKIKNYMTNAIKLGLISDFES